jgi:hypothetical protein
MILKMMGIIMVRMVGMKKIEGMRIKKDEATHMEVEQTMNPGANQGPIGDNRNNTNFKQNDFMVTFGTLPPSPIKEEVSLPCVFTAEVGSVMPSERTGKNLNKIEAQNGIVHEISFQSQKDIKGTNFEEDMMLDHVPIIGVRGSTSSSAPVQLGDVPATLAE